MKLKIISAEFFEDAGDVFDMLDPFIQFVFNGKTYRTKSVKGLQ